MNKILRQFALPVFLFAFASATQAAPLVINFDDQPADYPAHFNTGWFKYESGQMNIVDTTSATYSGNGYTSLATLTSSKYVLGNWFASTPVSFAANSGEVFDLTGFAAVGVNDAQTLTIVGYLNGAVTFQQDIAVTTTAQNYTFTGFTGIDKFEVVVPNSQSIVPDGKWALTGVAVTPVPEPETYMMLLAGLGIVASVARRRQAKS